MEFGALGCAVKDDHGHTLALAARVNNLYRLRCTKESGSEDAKVAASKEEGLKLWHCRMGHLNVKSLKKLPSLVSGLDLSHVKAAPSSLTCEGCLEGKQQRHSFPQGGATRATKLLELVHTDVCGPMKTMSMGGARFFLTFIDDYSRKM